MNAGLTALVTLAGFAIAMGGMAVGLLQKKPLRGSCGGPDGCKLCGNKGECQRDAD